MGRRDARARRQRRDTALRAVRQQALLFLLIHQTKNSLPRKQAEHSLINDLGALVVIDAQLFGIMGVGQENLDMQQSLFAVLNGANQLISLFRLFHAAARSAARCG